MIDIVKRMRKWAVFGYGYEASCDMKEAATEIEQNRIFVANAVKAMSEQANEIERLRAALREIAKYEVDEGCPCSACEHSAIARAALEGK